MLLYRRTPPWKIASFPPLHLICLIVICLAIWPSAAKGGRGGGGGRGSGSRGGSSRGGGWGSSSGGSRTSRWGTSQSSGSRNSYGSRPSYTAGAAYRAPSKTMSRISANSSSFASGASNSSYPRAQAHIPAASGPTIRIVYTPVFSSYTSYRQGYSGTNMAMVAVGGNALGSIMSRLYSGYGYETTGGHAGYVPYRDRYHDYLTTTTPGPTTTDIYDKWREQVQMINCMQEKSFDECYYTTTSTLAPIKPKEIDLCILARWNRELPYTEVPNMALMFLANDTISGNTTSDKAKFTYEFFKELPHAYASYNSSGDTFMIPESYDLKKCNIQPTEGIVDLTQNATESTEEPIVTAARNIIMLYSNISETADNLPDVVAAAKACLPRTDYPPYPRILPCLQYSLVPDHLIPLNEAKSVFGNGEMCRKQLNIDVEKCLPFGETAGNCRLEHLVALSLFARNYYLCAAELEEDTVRRIRERSQREHAEYQDWLLYGSGSNLSSMPRQGRALWCYECTSGVNDGCEDPARVSKYATACPEGTQGCLTMKARGSPFIRSCGNPQDSPVPIRDGCVNKPGIGAICSCSAASLCNGGDISTSNQLNNTKPNKPEAAQSSTAAVNAEHAFGNTIAARISELPEEARAIVKTKIRDLLTRYGNIYLRADSSSSNRPSSEVSAGDHIPTTTTYRTE